MEPRLTSPGNPCRRWLSTAPTARSSTFPTRQPASCPLPLSADRPPGHRPACRMEHDSRSPQPHRAGVRLPEPSPGPARRRGAARLRPLQPSISRDAVSTDSRGRRHDTVQADDLDRARADYRARLLSDVPYRPACGRSPSLAATEPRLTFQVKLEGRAGWSGATADDPGRPAHAQCTCGEHHGVLTESHTDSGERGVQPQPIARKLHEWTPNCQKPGLSCTNKVVPAGFEPATSRV